MSHNAIFAQIKWVIVLLLLMLLDILPVPVLGLILLYVLLFRPLWFKHAVLEIYNDSGRAPQNGADDFK